MSRPAISVENLSKAYRIGLQDEIPDSLLSAASSWARSPFRNLRRLRRLNTFEGNGHDADDVLWALKDVSFDVQEGEVLGVIGRNGAGKSTLLKILSRITDPTAGRALIRGRVSSLLEVGTGFHDELTGRENVYMNATILGMTKREIDRRFDEIVDFSGVEKFLDTPVKRYSSGMKVRLAFAVAAHLEPEILIIDEVLAVGDAEFQRKCLGKMQDVATGGRTVLFVSHNMGAVNQLCGRGVLLQSGKITAAGATERVIDDYLVSASLDQSKRRVRLPYDGAKAISFIEAAVTADQRGDDDPLEISDALTVELTFGVREDIRGTNLAVTLSRDGIALTSSFDIDTSHDSFELRRKGTYCARIALPAGVLKAGRYNLSIGAGRPNVEKFEAYQDVLSFELDSHFHDTSKSSRAASRSGIVSLPMEWDLQRLDMESLEPVVAR